MLLALIFEHLVEYGIVDGAATGNAHGIVAGCVIVVAYVELIETRSQHLLYLIFDITWLFVTLQMLYLAGSRAGILTIVVK